MSGSFWERGRERTEGKTAENKGIESRREEKIRGGDEKRGKAKVRQIKEKKSEEKR